MKEFNQVVQVQASLEELRQLMRDEIQQVVDKFKKEESAKELPEWMSQKEIAQYYNVTRQTVGNWEKDHLLTRVVIGGIPKFAKSEVLSLQNIKTK